MGADQRGQATGGTHRAILWGTVLLVVLPGFSGTHGQQKQDAQQGADMGTGCACHNINGLRQWFPEVVETVSGKPTSIHRPKEINQGGG